MTKIVNMCKSESYESIDGEILNDEEEQQVAQQLMTSDYAQKKYDEMESLLKKKQATIDKIDMSKFRKAYTFVSVKQGIEDGIVEGR